MKDLALVCAIKSRTVEEYKQTIGIMYELNYYPYIPEYITETIEFFQ